MKFNIPKPPNFLIMSVSSICFIVFGIQIERYIQSKNNSNIIYVRPLDGSNTLCDGKANRPARFGKPCAREDSWMVMALWDGESELNIRISSINTDTKILQRKINFPDKDGIIELRK